MIRSIEILMSFQFFSFAVILLAPSFYWLGDSKLNALNLTDQIFEKLKTT